VWCGDKKISENRATFYCFYLEIETIFVEKTLQNVSFSVFTPGKKTTKAGDGDFQLKGKLLPFLISFCLLSSPFCENCSFSLYD
jgi:hypothetical protein